ncbi:MULTISPECIES: hypothetical protein [Herbaspirillum]|uniref:Uncharacterized protein n=3 Tax=root TaxID=1 RepID=A0AAJ2HAD0_9BURK|nr:MULTISPECIES: hypothetical protein [Herbaspirillum]MDR9836826.1 hypothetical protein [Herbaspirillum huttiense]
MKLKFFAAVTGLIFAGAVHAVEIKAASNDPVLTSEQFKTIVEQTLPASAKALNEDFRVIAILETTKSRPGEDLFFYSVMMHRKVIDATSKKVYWAQTGGVRGNGITSGAEALEKDIRKYMEIGVNSFKTDQ